MRKNRVVSVVVVPDAWGADVTLFRADKTVRALPDGSATRRALQVLSDGAYNSTIQHAINVKTGYSYIVSITYTPMQFSESKYREVLQAVYAFFANNIDGFLEDNERADYFWHLLGAMVGLNYEHWKPADHREAFYMLAEPYKQAWEQFFNDPRGKF